MLVAEACDPAQVSTGGHDPGHEGLIVRVPRGAVAGNHSDVERMADHHRTVLAQQRGGGDRVGTERDLDVHRYSQVRE